MSESELWRAARAKSTEARATGALVPHATESELVHDGGLELCVRTLAGPNHKPSGGGASPFLPPDPALLVRSLPPAHLCLLNKYPVLEPHLLIVTAAFAEQDELLDHGDFEALWPCLRDSDGLAFFNGGRIAGASQRHRHLQLVPPALGPHGLPIAPVVEAALARGLERVPELTFAHRLAPIDAQSSLEQRYREILRALFGEVRPGERLPPHNWLATPRWLLLVPRRAERFGSVSINALGFAGSLLARNAQELALLRQAPLAALATVAGIS